MSQKLEERHSDLQPCQQWISHTNLLNLQFLERSEIIRPVTESKKTHFPYKDFFEFTRQMFKMKFGKKLQIGISEKSKLIFKYFSKPYLIPKFQINIDKSLEFTLATYGFLLPDDHKFLTLGQKIKKTLVSGNPGDEKNLHLPIYFLKSFFKRYSLFFFNSFCFVFVFLFFFFFCLQTMLLKLNIYILIHCWVCGRESDKKSFTRPIFGNKTVLFWPYWSIQGEIHKCI